MTPKKEKKKPKKKYLNTKKIIIILIIVEEPKKKKKVKLWVLWASVSARHPAQNSTFPGNQTTPPPGYLAGKLGGAKGVKTENGSNPTQLNSLIDSVSHLRSFPGELPSRGSD